jgi:cell division protein FtsQ
MKKFLIILEISLWVLFAGGLFTLLGFTNTEYNDMKCRNYVIRIDYGKADVLVTQEDVYNLVKQSGHVLKGQTRGNINFEKIERELRRYSYISGAQVYMTIDGIVHLDVVQRQPILRVFNAKGESFYLDGLGKLLPLNPAFSARVLVATGKIPEPFLKNINYLTDSLRKKDSVQYKGVMVNLYKLATFIIRDRFLRAQIEQIYVDDNGEFQMIPRVGNHLIIFGNAENIAEKFEKLLVFYRMGLNKTGWTKYNVINIKYKNQVVCSRI